MGVGHSARTIARGGGRRNTVSALLGIIAAGCGAEPQAGAPFTMRPDVVDFGGVEVGLPARASIVITNRRFDVLRLARVALPDSLSAGLEIVNAPAGVAAQAEARVDLVWTPDRRGDLIAQLLVQTQGGESVAVDIIGRATSSTLRVAPSIVDFSAVPLGRTSTRGFNVFNEGADPVRIDAVSPDLMTSPAFFAVLERPVQLEPGGRLPVTVSFRPQTIGLERGAFIVVDERNRPVPLSVGVRGEGITTELVVEPKAIEFAGVFVGERRSRSVVLRNRSPRAIEVGVPTVGGAAATEFSVAPAEARFLAPAAGLEVDVTYAPTFEGLAQAALEFPVMGRPLPLAVPLVGVAEADLAPRLRIDEEVDFGRVAVGRPVVRTVWLLNEGLTAAGLGPPTITGPFSWLAEPARPTRLAPGEAHGYPLIVLATATGTVAGALVLPRGDRPGMPLKVALTATVGDGGPLAGAWPETWDLGFIPRGTEVRRSLALANDGTSPLEVVSVGIEGGAGRFAFDGPETAAVAPGARAGYAIRFLDEVGAGPYEAVFRVRTPEGTSEIALRAETRNPPPSAPPVVVELSWPGPGADLDLHLVRDAAGLFDVPADLTGCPTPVPAEPARTITRTASAGPGVERAILGFGAAEAHRVTVSNRNRSTLATATVRIWSYGRYQGQSQRRIAPGEAWEVADLSSMEPDWLATPTQPAPAGGRCY